MLYLSHAKAGVSAEKEKAREKTWISKPDGNSWRTESAKKETRNRQTTADSLKKSYLGRRISYFGFNQYTKANIRIPIHMLPRPNRLPSFEISNVMRSGKRVSGNGVTLIYWDKGQKAINSNQISRFAFIVSTKVDKRAVVRNRMRRLMSESVRHHVNEITTRIDGVFVGSKSIIGLTQRQVEVIIRDLLQSAGFFAKDE